MILTKINTTFVLRSVRYSLHRTLSNKPTQTIKLFDQEYETDEWTNIKKNVHEKIGRNLLHTKYHPLNHLANKIKHFFYKTYVNRSGTPLFSVYDSFKPIVSIDQNFDSLLTPKDHVSRSVKDCFYVNKNLVLRSHTTAHDNELIKAGLDAFLTFGDVYRRDEIDSKHYPVFHQCDAVRLFDKNKLFNDSKETDLDIFETNEMNQIETNEKQKFYTLDACKVVEYDLKNCLTNLVQFIFGSSTSKLNLRWTESKFPFTHPSWELEIEYKGTWYEVLGCGVLKQDILKNAGADQHIAWAFGLGLERWAMILYDIQDIRSFWSLDPAFINQFKYEDPNFDKFVQYKPVSIYPPCTADISFWLPQSASNERDKKFNSNDFYDLVRDLGGDLVEQVSLLDEFYSKKLNKTSHMYRIVYRSMDRILTQVEVNVIHKKIEEHASKLLGVQIR